MHEEEHLAAKEAAPEPPAAKQPRSPLEVAISSGNRSAIQAAIVELKASGVSSREVSRLHMKAVSEFGFGPAGGS